MIHPSLESYIQVARPNELLIILMLFSFAASRPQPDGNSQHRTAHNVKPLTIEPTNHNHLDQALGLIGG